LNVFSLWSSMKSLVSNITYFGLCSLIFFFNISYFGM